ncbi:MAG TPA: hypothetical protein VN894_11555 [Polyangiaceae bacterium]|nr:hypothetical protein [Polyangiaceae bacterium]
MNAIVKIGLVGDRSDKRRAHGAIPRALESAARLAGLDVSHAWLSTAALAGDAADKFRRLQRDLVRPRQPCSSSRRCVGRLHLSS